MSDHISQRYGKNEVFEIVGNAAIRERESPYQLQWVAHWTRASSSTTLQSHEHCAVTNLIKDHIGEKHYLPVEIIKPSNNSLCSGWRRDTEKRVNILSNSKVENNVKSLGSEEFEEQSVRKLPASSINWEHFSSHRHQNSRSSNSDWSHFPMLDINRKLETIMDPKKRTSFNTMIHLHESSLAPYSIEFLSEKHLLQQEHNTGTNDAMIPYDFLGGLTRRNCQRRSMRSSNRTGGKNDIFGPAPEFKGQIANANLAYLNHDPCSCSNHRCSHSSLIGLKDRSNAIVGYAHCSCVAEECSRQRENGFAKNKTILGLSKSNKMSNSTRVASTVSGNKKEENYLSDARVMEESSMDLCQVLVDGDSTVLSNVRGTAFFEKLTLPSMLHWKGRQEEKLQFPVSLMNNVVGVEGIDRHSTEKQDESSVKTDMQEDVRHILSSHGVGNSPEAREIPQTVKSSKTIDTVTDISTVKSMDVESYVGKPSNPLSRATQLDSEQSSKWVKRLRSYPLDPFPLVAKRFKTQDPSSSSEIQNLLTRVVNYNKSFSNLPEGKQLNETTFLSRNGELSPEDSAKLVPWIRRWCKRTHEKSSHTEADNAAHRAVLCEPQHSRLLPQMFEVKQLPSLAAMALVGKQVTNFRPCEFQKRGPTLVWNV